MVPEGHVAAFVLAKASAMGLVPQPLSWLWESPPHEELSHSLKFFLHVREQFAEQYDLDPARCPKLQEKNKHMDPVLVKVWRKVTRGGNTAKPELCSFRANRNKSQDPRTLTSLVINSEIRHLSGDKNVKVIFSALGMGSFWSWKALKGSSSFSPSYFCLSEHKLLQPLPRLLVSETKPFPFRPLQAPSTISFSLTC